MQILNFTICLALIDVLLANISSDEILIRQFQSDEVILEKIIRVASEIKSLQCQKDLNFAVNGLRERKQWAIAMFDSSVKSPVGIEFGVEFQFGNFDQCMEIKTDFAKDGVNIEPKYCLVDVTMDGYQIRNAANRHREINNSTIVHWGICLPASCSNGDVIDFMRAATGYSDIQVNPKSCQTNRTPQYSKLEIIFGFTILSFIAIVTCSTLFHMYVIYVRKTTKLRKDILLEEIIKAFSAIANIKKLGKESKDEYGMGCVNGIKAIAMFFIISGHALVFMVGGPVQNSVFYKQQSVQLQNAFLQNSPLLVDSFLVLSGFLFARLVLIEMDKRCGKINFILLYVFRYVRLTPAYLAMIGFYSTWFIRIGDGPLWNSRISLEQQRCQESWWKNILYINNYIGNDALCMFQSWYLAADTQLFIFAPLLIYPLWKCKNIGIHVLSIVTVISIITPFYVTYSQNLDPTFIVWANEVSDLSANDYFINTYGKTHMRATGYVIGVMAGYIAYYLYKQELTISKRARSLMWITAIITGAYSMYSVTFYYDPAYQYSHLEASLYNSLHRLGWSCFTAWIVVACITGDESALKNFLSSRALVPLSRLTYCAYLTNGFIELYLAATIRTPKFMSVTNLLGETLSHVCLTFLAALMLCLMFESPIHGIEKMILRRSNATRQKTSDLDDLHVNSRSTSTSEASSV